MTNIEINCAVECVEGCRLGDRCPNKEYVAEASQFINKTSLDQMLEIAEVARRKKLTESPKWIIPEDI
ncbi:MAG TPA: hypothetical protein ACFCUY_12925 [Xenococcaceae cyanobacterium]|jgi:hypothetical protein